MPTSDLIAKSSRKKTYGRNPHIATGDEVQPSRYGQQAQIDRNQYIWTFLTSPKLDTDRKHSTNGTIEHEIRVDHDQQGAWRQLGITSKIWSDHWLAQVEYKLEV